jgi:hypothetical protein
VRQGPREVNLCGHLWWTKIKQRVAHSQLERNREGKNKREKKIRDEIGGCVRVCALCGSLAEKKAFLPEEVRARAWWGSGS